MKKQERLRYNQKLLEGFNGFVFGQNQAPVAMLRYGNADRPVEQVGCAAAAVYNALKLAGKQTDLCEVLSQFEALRMPWLFGLFGTKPLSLRRFFRRNNIPFSNYFNLKRFEKAMTEGKTGIVCTWNKRYRGIHFYCVCVRDGKALSFNQYYSDHALDFSFEELSSRRFVVGYIIGC